ncbi:MAG: metal-dependent transcriptional regulator [bacterium]
MNLSEPAEEILEALWIAYEETNTKRLKLSALRVIPEIGVLLELIDAGIITHAHGDDAVTITERGLIEARDAIRRHRLSERLLTDILLVKRELIHETACQFEHHLHKGVDTNICTLLGHPKVCPHGRPIPPGECCEEGLSMTLPAVSPLAKLKPGDGGWVAYLHTTDPRRAQMLISMGVVPGVDITLLAGFPSFLFQIGEGQFAVDQQIAEQIYVRLQR